ncbi:hypothetical protein [Bacillus cereus group sp. TH152-1LC]|uniref:hypothetical protein n=1 Tax=Bacillus cereus group sp. TH152-1LC TaxID=3018060 RepID=UPI0022E628B4|nr:hypothetical protein [Bacillus cereus group sp. TH152-1LC]MDA1675359.1 hypothetical protein [Bacillus cereus group sp. TH152-1LC]
MANVIKLFIVWALVLCIVLFAYSITDTAIVSLILKLTIAFFAAVSLYLIVYSIKTIKEKRKERRYNKEGIKVPDE